MYCLYNLSLVRIDLINTRGDPRFSLVLTFLLILVVLIGHECLEDYLVLYQTCHRLLQDLVQLEYH